MLVFWVVHAAFIVARMLLAPQLQPPWVSSYDSAVFFACMFVGYAFMSAARYEIPGFSFLSSLSGAALLLRARMIPAKGFEPVLLRFDSGYFFGFSFSYQMAIVMLGLMGLAVVCERRFFGVLSYRLVSSAFLLLSAAMVLRGFWMYELQGEYWVWDSTTNVMLLSWFFSVFYLHAKRIQ
jgi:ABC-type transport system involved in cytochrome c biogenesis permease subunit